MEIKALDLVKAPSLQKYSYDISNNFTFSGKIGRIYPVSCVDCIPGDTIEHSQEIFGRLAPTVHPILQNVRVTFYDFFVPYRLMYPKKYDKVLTAGDSTTAFPWLRFTNSEVWDKNNNYEPIGAHKQLLELIEFFGAPVETWRQTYIRKQNDAGYNDIVISPVLAYFLIWNEYFRDSLKQSEILVDNLNLDAAAIKSSSLLNAVPFNEPLLRANYPRDYFNTAQYEPQYGSNTALPNVSVSGSTASTSSITINKLKELIATQNWKDVGNMFGKRYIEQVLGHFGVHSSDSRLQRPELVKSHSFPLQISEVTQLSQTTDSSPLGEMAGRGVVFGGSESKSFFCEEHGYYITLMVSMPEQSYMNGCPRWLRKRVSFDFAFPEFANIGEQEVYSSELLDNGNGIISTIGYQERYAEYKRSYNRVAGEFARTLKAFTMGIDLTNEITTSLSDIMTPNESDIDRVFAVPNTDHLYITLNNNTIRHSVLPYVNRQVNNSL